MIEDVAVTHSHGTQNAFSVANGSIEIDKQFDLLVLSADDDDDDDGGNSMGIIQALALCSMSVCTR